MHDVNKIKQYEGWYLPSNRPIDENINDLMVEDQDGKIIAKMELHLKLIVQSIITSIDYDKSYCMTFKIPAEKIENLTNIHPSIPEKEILLKNMTGSWENSKNEKYEKGISPQRESYSYIILEFIILYALRRNQDKYPHTGSLSTVGLYNRPKITNDNPIEKNPIARIGLFICCLKLWNGGINVFFKIGCNSDIMKYVVSTKMNNNYYAHKFDTPLQLIREVYIEGNGKKPSIPRTYFFRMFLDSTHSIQIVEASWKRLRQLFGSSKRENIKHQKTEGYTSGLAPLYYDAHRNNERYSKLLSMDADDSSIEDSYSVSSYDDSILNITNNIAMKSGDYKYPTEFKEYIKKNVKNISFVKLDEITGMIHKLKYQDQIQMLLEKIFSRLGSISEDQICVKTFFPLHIKKSIISSKHHEDVISIKKICEDMLIDFLKETNDIDFTSWSKTQKNQYVSIVLYSAAYNIQQYFCKK